MVILFTITLFVSSALLFLLQPMFAKMVLPLLGGTPAVWNTCVIFFRPPYFLDMPTPMSRRHGLR
jgi:hypothetical protein